MNDSQPVTNNVPEYSVSEISGAIKKTVEDAFGYIRIRGELGRVSRSGNGHCYLDMKDERAVLSAVIWKGSWGRLSIKPEQGMEVVATGRLTTFAGQSRYQLVIDTLEPAGAGALMALLEARKKQLAAEGLFAAERKRPLPRLPNVVGVVTSPTGAVIRDILHRLRDRFPIHVLVWPTAVQGDSAPKQITAGIEGFNRLPENGPVPRPEVLIVARGGGSLEDLWGFNDEAVVRAAAASQIPLISAVGHETDTTLIDYAADVRAPTPTAAAEMAVPVRIDLLNDLSGKSARLAQAMSRRVEQRQLAFQSAARGLGRPETLIEPQEQRFDRAAELLGRTLRQRLDQSSQRLAVLQGQFSPGLVTRGVSLRRERLGAMTDRLAKSRLTTIEAGETRLSAHARLLEGLSYRGVLERGFALVMDEAGHVIRRAKQAKDGQKVQLRFVDGQSLAVIVSGDHEKSKTPRKLKSTPPSTLPQGSLFEE